MEKSRGRVEKRTLTTTTNLVDSGYLKWPGAAQLIKLEREVTAAGETRKTVTYAITSLRRTEADAKTLLGGARGRWAIENSCFYVLDVALGEDACRVRTGSAAHALSTIRHAAVNLCQVLGQSVTATLREHAVKVDRLLHRLNIFKK